MSRSSDAKLFEKKPGLAKKFAVWFRQANDLTNTGCLKLFQNLGSTSADRLVGGNVRRRRVGMNIAEAVMASRLGCRLGDLQAFEAGDIRPTAAGLAAIAGILNSRVSEFFAQET